MKAMKLAINRTHGITRPSEPGREYQVHLSMLVNGKAAGWGIDRPLLKLWVEISRPFQYLLEILRQQSTLCNKAAVEGKTANRGYTLADGPWMYRLTKKQRAIGQWYELKDEQTFRVMLDSLKANEQTCIMMHVCITISFFNTSASKHQ